MIKFEAALKQTSHPFKISAEGEAEGILIVSKRELTKALPLVAHGDKTFTVAIKEPEDREEDFEF